MFTALLDVFPGKVKSQDREHTSEEIKENIPRLVKLIKDNNIDIVIPIGKLAIKAILNQTDIQLHDTIGNEFFTKPFGQASSDITIIPLPQPSGISTWVYKDENKQLLNRALSHAKKKL